METVQQKHRLGYRQQCERLGVAYSSFKRWRSRAANDQQVIARPGPKKVEPLDLEALREELRVMRHGRKRTAGTGALYQRYRDQISRRDLQRLVEEERRDRNRERNRIYNQVNWKVARLVWAMDDTEYRPFPSYPPASLHNVQDLGSRYKFRPLVGPSLATGEAVAANLLRLFEQHGPPLFLKRDNGGNLNHHLVNELLGAFLVIPVNSPCYYPQYNGGIEAAQREIKQQLTQQSPAVAAFLAIQADLEVQDLNHKKKPCLGFRTPCRLFHAGRSVAQSYNKRKRREIYDIIRSRTKKLVDVHGLDVGPAWRLAIETWLLEHDIITVSKRNRVLPPFPEKKAHN